MGKARTLRSPVCKDATMKVPRLLHLTKPAQEDIRCACADGWVCEEHPHEPWQHDGCGGAAMLCQNPECVLGRALRTELDAATARW
jgi:hypothetical protein